MRDATESLVLGGGCFWCLEAAFKVLPGVIGVDPGYAGGAVDSPTYEQVCTGETGHAEVVRVRYDPAVVAVERIFDLFFAIHDPTTPDRQGADIGTQYRSLVLYADEAQHLAAAAAVARARAAWPKPIVTELAPLAVFWPAEEYHRDFFAKNPEHGYCRVVIAPKVRKALDFAAVSRSRPARR